MTCPPMTAEYDSLVETIAVNQSNGQRTKADNRRWPQHVVEPTESDWLAYGDKPPLKPSRWRVWLRRAALVAVLTGAVFMLLCEVFG